MPADVEIECQIAHEMDDAWGIDWEPYNEQRKNARMRRAALWLPKQHVTAFSEGDSVSGKRTVRLTMKRDVAERYGLLS